MNTLDKPKSDDDWYEENELPPAGTDCEYFNNYQWVKCHIHIILNGYAVFTTPGTEGTPYVRSDPPAFRPAKTERDALVEKCTKILAKGVGDCEPDKYLAQQIVDAGWQPIEPMSKEELFENMISIFEKDACKQNYSMRDGIQALIKAGCRFVK